MEFDQPGLNMHGDRRAVGDGPLHRVRVHHVPRILQKSARQSVGDHVIPYLRAANIADTGLKLDDVQTMNFDPKEQAKYGLERDDVLLVEGGSIGLAARWNGDIAGPVGFDKHVIRLRARPNRSTSEYALQWARWSRESGAFDAQATGITIRALGFGRASHMPIPNLDVATQESLMAPLAAADVFATAQREELSALRNLRSTLLMALMTQSISIPKLDDVVIGGCFMSGFSESSTVQKWLVDRLTAMGWSHMPGKQLMRANTEVLVEHTLVPSLKILNSEIHKAPDRIDEVLPLIRMTTLAAASEGLIAANERMVTLLRGHHTVKYVGTEKYVPLRLIDFEDSSNNTYVVSDEVTFGPPGHERRFDLVLWVNGIPLVVVETKTPVKASVSWLNGARDLANLYTVEHPEFFAPNVLMAATEGRAFHYGAVGQKAENWLMWGSTADPYDLDGFERVNRSVDLLLTPARVLSVLRDFTLFEQAPGGLTRKLIPRYPQVEGAELIHQRVLSGGRQGLIWHYQGTGKTLLMAFAALLLLNDPAVGGPTVLVVLDRLDLIEQVERQFKTAGLPRVTTAETKQDLRRILREDQRGIVLTTIFRFEDAGLLNNRDNIVVLVDEAHRTTEGSLGDDMRKALPRARFFGLTGTPISDKERNTFKLFGDPGEALRPDRGLHRAGFPDRHYESDDRAVALKAANPETGGKRPVSTDELATEFVARMETTLSPRFDGIDRSDRGFEALQAAIQRLPADGDARDRYAREFTGIQTLWEFLYPHEVLDEHLADYKWLAQGV